jgi:hypothetical protein
MISAHGLDIPRGALVEFHIDSLTMVANTTWGGPVSLRQDDHWRDKHPACYLVHEQNRLYVRATGPASEEPN